jgi:hypothetical protein
VTVDRRTLFEDFWSQPFFSSTQVAIVYDYEAHWITAIQPHGANFRYPELVFRWYEAIRRLGLDVDFTPPGERLDNYRRMFPGAPIASVACSQLPQSASQEPENQGSNGGNKMQITRPSACVDATW